MGYIPHGPFNDVIYSTVKITTNTGSGTGFFYRKQRNEQEYVVFLITNKHVLENVVKAEIYIHIDQQREVQLIELDLTTKIDHPNSDIDLTAIIVSYIFIEAKKQGKTIRWYMLDKSILPTEEDLKTFSIIEEVCMIGYPIGLEDIVNHYPLIRKGITATHPMINYNDNEEFMIDMACLPGSSGSPVLLLSDRPYSAHGTLTISDSPRILFLGVMYAGPQQSHTGELIPVNISLKPIIQTLAHLGFVIKSSVVEEFAESILKTLNIEIKPSTN